MKKYLLLLSFALFCLIVTQKPGNAMGFLYTDVSYPVTATGVTSTQNINYLKKGTSSALNVLWCVELGDAGINSAMKEAGIKRVNYIDVSEKTVFFFFRRITTNVYGD